MESNNSFNHSIHEWTINFFIVNDWIGWVEWSLMEWLPARFIEEFHSSYCAVVGYRFSRHATPIKLILQLNPSLLELFSFFIHEINWAMGMNQLMWMNWRKRVCLCGAAGAIQWNGANSLVKWSWMRQSCAAPHQFSIDGWLPHLFFLLLIKERNENKQLRSNCGAPFHPQSKRPAINFNN